MGKNFGFSYILFCFMGSHISIPILTLLRYREVLYTIFRTASGSLAPPLDRNLRNFSFGFVVNPITVQNFSFLGYLEVHGNFLRVLLLFRGPGFVPGQKFWVFGLFPSSSRATVISIPIFMLLRYWEVLYTINRLISGAPGSAPGQKFSIYRTFTSVWW